MALDFPGLFNPIFNTSTRMGEGFGVMPQEDTTHLCKVYKAASQTLVHNTPTYLQWDTEPFDLNDMHNNTTNNTRVTIKTPGIYLINGMVQVDFVGTPATSFVSLTTVKNRTTALTEDWKQYQGFAIADATATAIAKLNQGDYIELSASQWNADASDAETDPTEAQTKLEVYKLSN